MLNHSKLAAPLGVCLFLFVYFIPAFGFDLVWDDFMFLYDSRKYTADESWLKSALESFFVSANYFRPIPLMSYRVDALLSGDLSGFHVSQVIYYVAAAGLVYISYLIAASAVMTTRLRGALAFIVVFNFVHPVNIENAAWVSCRFEVLLLLFGALTFVVSRLDINSKLKLVLVFFAYLLACLSKEMAVVIPVIIALLDWFDFYSKDNCGFKDSVRRTVLKRYPVYLTLIAAGVAYLFLRYVFLGYVYYSEDGLAQHYGTLLQKILIVAKSYGYYVSMYFSPFSTVQPMYSTEIPVEISDLVAWGCLIFGGLFAVLNLVNLVKNRSSMSLMFVLFMVALLPVVNILPMVNGVGVGASRFMLLPSVFLSVAIVMLCVRLFESVSLTISFKRVIFGLLVLWVGAIVVSGRVGLYRWSDNLALWSWAAEKEPSHPSVLLNYVGALKQFGHKKEGTEKLKRYLKRGDIGGVRAYSMLANSYHVSGEFAEAKKNYNIAIAGVVNEMERIISLKGETASELDFLTPLLGQYYSSLAGVLYDEQVLDGGQDKNFDFVLDLLETSERVSDWSYRQNALFAFVYLRTGRIEEAAAKRELYLANATEKEKLRFLSHYRQIEAELGGD